MPIEAETFIAKCRETGAIGVDMRNSRLIDEAFVGKFRDAGLKFWVWTVNDISEARRLEKIGVDGITTDTASTFDKLLN